ncbi:MAG: alpha-amylase family glycosyl hydrolase [Polyangiales bacterium]
MPAATPWWASTSIYQVYPRSFADANGDGIGDLPGVLSRLDHLVDLGVQALWLSPFVRSPQRDFGYDITDYRDVAPEYGTLDDAQRLLDEAHRRGLKVLFDLVLNHTSDEHPWFVESRASRTNPRADWYVWSDGRRDRRGRPVPPNNWRSELQLPRAWQWSEARQQWYLASFLSFQPDLNWRHPAVRAEMFDMVRMWLGRGVDGFRLDIFGSCMQDAALRDNDPWPTVYAGIPRLQTPNRTLNTEDCFALAGDLRAVCDEFGPDRVLLGEVFGPSPVLRRYVSDGGRAGLHLVFLFDFLAARYAASVYRALIARFERDFPPPMAPTWVLENHDRARSLSRLGGDLRKARVLATLLCTLRGVAVIYQGQEIGMENRYIPLADAKDPVASTVAKHLPEWLNRRLPERLNRDEVRSPMQWTAAPNAGFCPEGVAPWLPLHDNRARRNVETEARDPDSLLTWYRTLLALRSAHEALREGRLELASDTPRDVIRFDRVSPHERLVVVVNLGDDPTGVRLGTEASLLAASDRGCVLERGALVLPPHTAVVARHG